MKKLLLTLGAVASVAAPVAAVVACSSDDSTNYGAFDKDVKAYQALQIMAYGQTGNISIAVPVTGKTWKYVLPTTIKDNVSSNNRKLVKTNDDDKALVSSLQSKVVALHTAALATFKAELAEVVAAHKSSTKSPIEDAATAVISAIEAPSATYASIVTAVAAKLDDLLSDKAAVSGDKLESLGEITTKDDVKLTDKEANLLKIGAPLLIKLQKTIDGMTAFLA